MLAEFLGGDEAWLARVRLVDVDHLLDGAGPRGEHRDPIGQEHRFAERMRHEYDRFGGARQQLREVFAQDHAGLLIERAERLVHQQDVGLQAERARERRTLAHAAGKLRRIMVHKVLEPHRFQRFARSILLLGFGNALEHHAELDVLDDRAPRKQRVFLEHKGDLLRQRRVHGLAADLDTRRRSASADRRSC